MCFRHFHWKIHCFTHTVKYSVWKGGAHESDKSQDFHGMVTMEILQDFLCMVIHGMSHKKNVSNLPLKKLGLNHFHAPPPPNTIFYNVFEKEHSW